MKTIIIRPGLSRSDSKYEIEQLEEAFQKMKLVDKTICDDRIVYVFKEIDKQD